MTEKSRCSVCAKCIHSINRVTYNLSVEYVLKKSLLNVSQCVCAICSAAANYVSKKSSKPEALKALGVAGLPSRVAPPNHTKCECCACSAIHFRFGLPESWHRKYSYFCICKQENIARSCALHSQLCMSICIALSHESLFLLTLLCIAKTCF